MNERFELADAPATPEQVKKLGKIVMGLAAEYGKVKKAKRFEKSHGFVDEIELPDMERHEGVLRRQHRLSMLMARQIVRVPGESQGESYTVGAREWSMKLLDTEWFEHEDKQWIGSRKTVRFRWDNEKVTQARRTMLAVPTETMEDKLAFEYMLDNHDDVTGGLSWEESNGIFVTKYDYEELMHDDVEQLLDDVGSYTRMSRSVKQ